MRRLPALFLLLLLISVAAGLSSCGDGGAAPAAAVPATASSGPAEDEIVAALTAAERYLESGDLPEAEAILARLVDRAPVDARARELYGRLLVLAAVQMRSRDPGAAKELFERAYAQYEEAATLSPRSAGLQQSAGTVAVEADRPEAALRHFQAAARLDPLDPQPPLYAAQMLLQAGRLDEAAEQLERVEAIDPDLPEVHASLAIIALERQRYDEARRRIALARELEPADLRLRVQAARIERRAGDPPAALALLAGLDDHERAQATVAEEIAADYAALGDSERAAAAWAHRYRATPGQPGRWRAAARAAEIWLAAGRPEEARIWLEQARLEAPGAPELAELAKRLK